MAHVCNANAVLTTKNGRIPKQSFYKKDIRLFCSCGHLTRFTCRHCKKPICPCCGEIVKYSRFFKPAKLCLDCIEKSIELFEIEQQTGEKII